MSYFPVDDRFHSHPKAAAASLAAIGLWTVAGSWVNEHLTDGDVPEHMARLLSRGTIELADELVTVGLWRRTKAGYRFHQWHADGDGSHRNITRSEKVASRAKVSSGGKLGNHRRWHLARAVSDPDCDFCQPKSLSGGRIGGRTEPDSGANPPSPIPSPIPRKKTSSSAPPTDEDPAWAEFWAAYPRKVDKANARKAWPRAVKAAPTEEIILGAKRYAERRRGQDPTFTAHPTTWLNGERWKDESPERTQPRGWWDE